MSRLRIFTWHIHGSYLYYLSQGDFDLYLPKDPAGGEGYQGRGDSFSFGDNVMEIPVSEVKYRAFDCILFQSEKNYHVDQYEILSKDQRSDIPMIYLEHDPPRKHPTDTIHVMDNPEVTVVHVTGFNKLMWDNKTHKVEVIEHGVVDPHVDYQGDLARGVVVINNLPERGRRLGADIFLEVSKQIPLDLIGMNSEAYGGLGEVPLHQLPFLLSRYRFFFNPIRYTSLGLAVCEAMMVGIPVVGLATTELVTVIRDNISGFIDIDPDVLVKKMKLLLNEKSLAIEIGRNGQETARERFEIERFKEAWKKLFTRVVSSRELVY